MSLSSHPITTTCCIAGGGPAGIMLGFLLARAGIDVIVLEKWPDFFRDFRGDTIHPSTMNVLYELGLLDAFLQLPHNKTYVLEGEVGGKKVLLADFSLLRTRCPFIAFMPQWDFLTFITQQAQAYPNFTLLMETTAEALIEKEGKIVGVTATRHKKHFNIYADVIIAADGRHSTLRQHSGLVLKNLGAPMDVLWFRLSRHINDPFQSLGRIDLGAMLIMIDRGDYWQCGFLIRKGSFDKLRQEGLPAFQARLAALMPDLKARVQELKSFEQIKLLEVRVDRLAQWYRPGFLCIGDAAHAMSPIGGVGINLAIQDAVASANALIPALLKGTLSPSILAAIQRRREKPTKIIQKIQILIQNKMIDKILGKRKHPRLPLSVKLLQRFSLLQRLLAYLIGIGIQPEHVNAPTPTVPGNKK